MGHNSLNHHGHDGHTVKVLTLLCIFVGCNHPYKIKKIDLFKNVISYFQNYYTSFKIVSPNFKMLSPTVYVLTAV